jgi:putative flippase GtrA
MLEQAKRFGLVGLLATAVHLLVGSTLILWGIAPELANPVAFCFAFCVSFAGHYTYSFAAVGASFWPSAFRFALVAVAGFSVNQSILVTLVSSGRLNPVPSLFVSTFFATSIVFLLSKFWAFRGRKPRVQH